MKNEMNVCIVRLFKYDGYVYVYVYVYILINLIILVHNICMYMYMYIFTFYYSLTRHTKNATQLNRSYQTDTLVMFVYITLIV